MNDSPPAIPAATLVLMRSRPGSAPEILLVERAGRMAFAAGAMVFPGGRVDPVDRVLAARAGAVDLDPADAAGRIAAIRETIEEVGIAIGIQPPPSPDDIAAIRAALAAGGDFATLVAERRWTLDLSALVPFARWRPDGMRTRTFDTRFYVAEVRDDAEAIADGGECVRAIWIDAQSALDEAEARRFTMLFPTLRNLERIAAHPGFARFVAHAGAHEIRLITPWSVTLDGVAWLCIPDDLGYPVTRERHDRLVRD